MNHQPYLTFHLLIATIALSLLPCAVKADDDEPKKRIVCSTTQIADFARNVVGDRCIVDGILGAGVLLLLKRIIRGRERNDPL